MTKQKMLDLLEIFCEDETAFIFSFWDERTPDKKLLCASHDEAVVCRYYIGSPLPTEVQKENARATLGELEDQHLMRSEELREPLMKSDLSASSTVLGETFLVVEIDWNSLSAERRNGLLAGCGYWSGMSKEPWDNMLPTVQVLLARELERVSGGTATFVHSDIMEELRHEPGWEEACDPRLTGEAGR